MKFKIKGRKHNSGLTLVEVMLVMVVLIMSALMLTATFPTSQISRMKAVHMSYATSLAQQKIEELRSAGYSGVLLGSTTEVPAELPSGTITTTVTQYATNIKKIEVAIDWSGYRKVGSNCVFVTLISDHT